MATEKIKIKLQGHEKFALREGWINKALQILPENPDAFTRRDATDLFGIGSNMVKSLRYWMRAFGLTNNAGTNLEISNISLKEYEQDITASAKAALNIVNYPSVEKLNDKTTIKAWLKERYKILKGQIQNRVMNMLLS